MFTLEVVIKAGLTVQEIIKVPIERHYNNGTSELIDHTSFTTHSQLHVYIKHKKHISTFSY